VFAAECVSVLTAGTSPSSDGAIAAWVGGAGSDPASGDVGATWGAGQPHDGEIVGGEARANVIAGMLQGKKC
jgi:hypothetical protein